MAERSLSICEAEGMGDETQERKQERPGEEGMWTGGDLGWAGWEGGELLEKGHSCFHQARKMA